MYFIVYKNTLHVKSTLKMISKQEFRALLILDGHTLSSWARKHNHHVNTCHSLLDGKLRPTGYAARAIKADMRADGYLTDEDLTA